MRRWAVTEPSAGLFPPREVKCLRGFHPDRPAADLTPQRVDEGLSNPADARRLIGAPGEHHLDVGAAGGLRGREAEARHGGRDREGDGRQRDGAAGQHAGAPGPVAPN